MKIFTLDFETYYDNKYSLKKITTEEYLRSPEFEIIGVGIAEDSGPVEWIAGWTEKQLAEFLAPLEGHCVLAHNAMFDGAILEWKLGVHPRLYLDTLSMARPHFGSTVGGSLEALAKHFNIGFKGDEVYDAEGKRFVDFSTYDLRRYGKYCENDVDLTRKLFNKLRPLTPRLELAHIHNTLTMFTRPILRLDVPLLERHLGEIQATKETALENAGVDIATVRSDAKLAEEMRNRGYEAPTKISPRTNKEAYAFSKDDKEFTDLLNIPDPDIQNLVEARLTCKSTIQESRTKRFIGIAKRGSFPVRDVQ